tara:strand:+ start:27 stop:296 length:270 start_codon:yes stop_codon:yes gene_type:complete
MTDSSSEMKKDMVDMAAELMSVKMDAAKKEGQMTHVLRIGSFHMEIVPNDSIDIEKMFEKTLKSLMERYDEKLIESGEGLISQSGKMYG